MKEVSRVVIIGAGPAGVSVVETIRGQSRAPEIIMLSAEPTLPYSPPAMMDHFLTGSENHLWRDREWPSRMAVDYRAGVRAVAVDAGESARSVTLSTGERLDADALVIASGGGLYAPLEGAANPGVFNFKSLEAATKLISQVRSGAISRVIIVGAGFIGVEIALILRSFGLEVILIEKLDRVMGGMIDHDTSALVVSHLRERGIWVLLDCEVLRFLGSRRSVAVELVSGRELWADAFVAATSTRPQIDFLARSGIARDWGVRVDERLRTSAPGVFAAGDVVEGPDRLTGQPFVWANFPNAIHQGRVVGANILGHDVRYEGAERLNSLLHIGLPVIVAGMAEGDEVLRWQSGRDLRTFYVRDDRLVGFQLVGEVRGAGWLRSLINNQTPLGRLKERLVDSSFGLGALAWGAIHPTLAT